MIDFMEHILDRIQGKAKKGQRRSSKWRKVRALHLIRNPKCAICNGTKKLTVHHILSYSVAPDLELEPSNLITLCESGKYGSNHHLLFGHLGNFRRINPSVISDVLAWHYKLTKEK